MKLSTIQFYSVVITPGAVLMALELIPRLGMAPAAGRVEP